ncbi:MAG: sodium:calcium antiporter [Planctomycetota bacterium]|nr:MAG: sodium:calcium antiporter [Planctomycetota bacterium]
MPHALSPSLALLLVIVGVALTYFGAELLIRGAARLARRFGMSPFVIGVTVVAFGTSAPELFASVRASLEGAGELGVGNVVGSNIANICLILGIGALLAPIAVNSLVIKRDAPIMCGISLLAAVTMLDQRITRFDGALLLAGIVAYVCFNYWRGLKDPKTREQALELEHEHGLQLEKNIHPRLLPNLLFTIIGLVGLTGGAALLVDGSVDLARWAGVPEIVIGATIVAFGTSVPELAASIQAARKGHADIAIGNVLGSNVFNLLCVLGAAALARPITVTAHTLKWHLPAMLLVSILIIPIMGSGRRIARVEGTLLLLAYFAYAVGAYVLRLA